MKKERNSNFELLRIVSMILILVFHSFFYSFSYLNDFCYNKILYILISSWGLVGVCCFVFISGWFNVKENYVFNIKRIIKLILQVIFYGLLVCFLCKLTNFTDIGWADIKKNILVLFNSEYWFVTAYIFLILLVPFLNKIIFSLNRSTLKKLVILLTIFSIYKTIYEFGPLSDIIYFVYLYLLIGYLKLTPNNFFERNAKKGCVMSFIFTISVFLWMFYMNTHHHIPYLLNNPSLVIKRHSVFMTVCSLFLFYVFKNMKIRNSKFINLISSTTLGIYLLHDNSLVRKWGNTFLHLPRYVHSRRFIFLGVGGCLLIFIIGIVIDLFRQYCLEKPIVDKILNRINFSKINNFFNNLL